MDLLFDKLDECFGINIPGAVDKMLGIDSSDNSKARANSKKIQDNQRSPHRLRPCIRQSGYRNRSTPEPSRHLDRDFDRFGQPDRATGRHRGREGPPKRVGFRLPGVKEPGDSDYPKVERVPWKDWDEELGAPRRSSCSRSCSWDGSWGSDIKAGYSGEASSTRNRHHAHTYRSKNLGREPGNNWDADREYPRHQPKTRRRAYSSPPPPIHRNRHNVYEYTTSGRGPSEAGATDNEYRPSHPPPRYHQNASAWSDEYDLMRDMDSSKTKPKYFREYCYDVELGKKETYSSSGGRSSRSSSQHSGCDGNISQRSRRSATF